MPDEPSTPDTPVETPDSPAAAPDPSEGEGTPETRQERRDGAIRAERDQLRTERDAANTRVAAMQRAEIHRRAATHLAAPADLDLVVGAEDYAACFTESGGIDEGTVAALLDKITTERPTWRKPSRGMDMGRYGPAPTHGDEATHADVFNQARPHR